MIFLICEEYGFVCNRAFEFEKLEYKNSQLHFNIFNQHVKNIINKLIKIDQFKN